MASVFNGLLLLFVSGGIAWEAIGRLWEPEAVATETVMMVAAVGILINGGTALLFARGRHGDLNVRGAFLHMLADAGISAGVVASAFLARLTHWLWLDPTISLLIVVAIGWGTLGLLTESLRLSLDAVPRGIDQDAVRDFLAAQPGVSDVHDLHIWPISTQAVALTAHLVRPAAAIDDALLSDIAKDLKRLFAIEHATLQIESIPHRHGCDRDH
jgi:cobalt-zinc-cadmium efflux system protein